jgi:serine/threonine protein kinase
VAFVQIPLALTWSFGSVYLKLKFDRDVAQRTLDETTKLFEATKLTAHKPMQLVADHDLVRLVGKGAYGEVWLARNAIGVYHAVKIVRRAAFPSDVPYEREFRGIQKFMPVSRSHPGFVHILHVGRNDTERCFYCIMEAGDDQTVGQKIDPETYTPKSLASELKWRGRLPAEETLRLGLALALALEHLHQSRLIHRDIKPGNIIFVNAQPKFADIGLVTDIAGEGKDVSFLGTQGYIPPEGPGSPGADVYALGKVLYESAMGRDREFFPEVPTAVYEEPEDSVLRQLQEVIFKACEASAHERYQTAAELHAALLEIEKRHSQRATRTE